MTKKWTKKKTGKLLFFKLKSAKKLKNLKMKSKKGGKIVAQEKNDDKTSN